jgi:hypothetical protein
MAEGGQRVGNTTVRFWPSPSHGNVECGAPDGGASLLGWNQGLWVDPCSPEQGSPDLNPKGDRMSIVGILIVIILILLVLYLVRRVV